MFIEYGIFKSLLSSVVGSAMMSMVSELVTTKPVFEAFRPVPTQTLLYSHKIWLDACNFGSRKLMCCTI